MPFSIGPDTQKHPMQVFTQTWPKHTLFPCLDAYGTDENMKKEIKGTAESLPVLLLQFLCSCTYN